MTTTDGTITTTVVLPDGTEAPLESDEAMGHIADVVRRAHGVPDNVDPDTGEVTEPLADAGDGQLFDGNIYRDPRLRIEKNGRTITDIQIGFGGTVPLRRHTVDHVEWHQDLKEGQEIELLVTATVTKDGFQFKPPTDKAGAKLIETKTLTVHTIDVLDAGEDD